MIVVHSAPPARARSSRATTFRSGSAGRDLRPDHRPVRAGDCSARIGIPRIFATPADFSGPDHLADCWPIRIDRSIREPSSMRSAPRPRRFAQSDRLTNDLTYVTVKGQDVPQPLARNEISRFAAASTTFATVDSYVSASRAVPGDRLDEGNHHNLARGGRQRRTWSQHASRGNPRSADSFEAERFPNRLDPGSIVWGNVHRAVPPHHSTALGSSGSGVYSSSPGALQVSYFSRRSRAKLITLVKTTRGRRKDHDGVVLRD